MSEALNQVMQCMEVWGGNQPVDAGVAMAGLDAWVFCRPYEDAAGGGDVYYVSACATGRITRLLVADVSGHGDRVSAIGAQLRTLMRRYVNYLDQKKFVRSLNSQFTSLTTDGMCFATAIVCTFFGPTRHLTLCNAGHPPPLLYLSRRKQWEILHRIEGANIPWGIDEVCNYDQFDVRLNIGDLVMCFTDSLTEARLPSGELLGQEGLRRIVSTLDLSNPAALTATLLAAIEAEGYRTDDDVTVLLFRPNGMTPRLGLVERWRVQGRMVRAMGKALRGDGPMPWPDLHMANIGGMFWSSLNRAWGRKQKTDQ